MGLIIFGTIWFWTLLSVVAILIIWFLEDAINYEKTYRDTGGGTKVTMTILAFLTLYFFFGSKEQFVQALYYIKGNPGTIILSIASYVVIGVIWSIVRWYFYLQGFKIHYIRKNGPTKNGISFRGIPKGADNKNRILTWMSYWPFSMFWTIINEPFRKVFRYIYSKIEGIYDKMAKSVFSDSISNEEE